MMGHVFFLAVWPAVLIIRQWCILIGDPDFCHPSVVRRNCKLRNDAADPSPHSRDRLSTSLVPWSLDLSCHKGRPSQLKKARNLHDKLSSADAQKQVNNSLDQACQYCHCHRHLLLTAKTEQHASIQSMLARLTNSLALNTSFSL